MLSKYAHAPTTTRGITSSSAAQRTGSNALKTRTPPSIPSSWTAPMIYSVVAHSTRKHSYEKNVYYINKVLADWLHNLKPGDCFARLDSILCVWNLAQLYRSTVRRQLRYCYDRAHTWRPFSRSCLMMSTTTCQVVVGTQKAAAVTLSVVGTLDKHYRVNAETSITCSALRQTSENFNRILHSLSHWSNYTTPWRAAWFENRLMPSPH